MERNAYQFNGPANYQFASEPQHKGTYLVIAAIIVIVNIIVVAVVGVVLQSIINASKDFDTVNNAVIGEPIVVREETPILDIYSKLNEQMSIEELSNIALQSQQNVAILLTDDGIGTIKLPNSADVIVFSHPLISEENDSVASENTETTDNEDAETTDNPATPSPVVDYPPSTVINDIRYVYDLGNDGYYIGYDDEAHRYVVYDSNETFELDTKADAIEAYLAPELEPQD